MLAHAYRTREKMSLQLMMQPMRAMCHKASMFQIFFTGKPVTDYKSCKKSNVKKFDKLFKSLLKRGVFVAPSQFEVGFLSSAHSKSDLTQVSEAYAESIKEVARS